MLQSTLILETGSLVSLPLEHKELGHPLESFTTTMVNGGGVVECSWVPEGATGSELGEDPEEERPGVDVQPEDEEARAEDEEARVEGAEGRPADEDVEQPHPDGEY